MKDILFDIIYIFPELLSELRQLDQREIQNYSSYSQRP